MQANTFTHALVRRPPESAVNGLRAIDHGPPSIDMLRTQHAAYTEALKAQGLNILTEDTLEAFPDSMFVEDVAFCTPFGAIILRPGAPSREGEAGLIQDALGSLYGLAVRQIPGGRIEGGDIMMTDEEVIIGLSDRTSHAGAMNLSDMLSDWSYTVRLAETPLNVLHFKTHSSYIGDGTVLSTPLLAGSGAFAGYDTILTADGEDGAANAVRVNDVLLVAAGFPRTRDRLLKRGFSLVELQMSEVAKLDGGLSCLSLRMALRQST